MHYAHQIENKKKKPSSPTENKRLDAFFKPGLQEQQNNVVDNKTEAEHIAKASAKLKNYIKLVESLTEENPLTDTEQETQSNILISAVGLLLELIVFDNTGVAVIGQSTAQAS